MDNIEYTVLNEINQTRQACWELNSLMLGAKTIEVVETDGRVAVTQFKGLREWG